MTRVFLVDDHPMVIEGLSAMLVNIPIVTIVGIATNAKSCLGYFLNHSADIILMDINLPDKSGIDLCSEIRKAHPEVKVIALSNFDQRIYVEKMKLAGASGYLPKNASSEDIQEALQQVMQGREYWNKRLHGKAEDQNMLLTRREVEVLAFIAEGLTNQEIADKIFVSVSTVDSHRKNLLSKLQVKNTASLVMYAIKNKII